MSYFNPKILILKKIIRKKYQKGKLNNYKEDEKFVRKKNLNINELIKIREYENVINQYLSLKEKSYNKELEEKINSQKKNFSFEKLNYIFNKFERKKNNGGRGKSRNNSLAKKYNNMQKLKIDDTFEKAKNKIFLRTIKFNKQKIINSLTNTKSISKLNFSSNSINKTSNNIKNNNFTNSFNTTINKNNNFKIKRNILKSASFYNENNYYKLKTKESNSFNSFNSLKNISINNIRKVKKIKLNNIQTRTNSYNFINYQNRNEIKNIRAKKNIISLNETEISKNKKIFNIFNKIKNTSDKMRAKYIKYHIIPLRKVDSIIKTREDLLLDFLKMKHIKNINSSNNMLYKKEKISKKKLIFKQKLLKSIEIFGNNPSLDDLN